MIGRPDRRALGAREGRTFLPRVHSATRGARTSTTTLVSPIAEEVIELLSDICSTGRPIPIAGFHGQIERLPTGALNGVKERGARRGRISAAVPPTNVAFGAVGADHLGCTARSGARLLPTITS